MSRIILNVQAIVAFTIGVGRKLPLRVGVLAYEHYSNFCKGYSPLFETMFLTQCAQAAVYA